MKILTVSELTSAIKSILEPPFRGISVQGEISNFKLQTSGHLYFNLKDAGSQISAVLFKGSAAQLSRLPKEGDQVVAKGELSIYAPRGSYQLVIRELQFLGVGELLLKLHQLKEKLGAQGWFEPTRKKGLPKLPKRIGVVTSPTGAVIQDILHILTRRFSGFHVILNPVKVQGDGAAAEIAQAIADFNRYDLADVLIVGRGGGSIEDLWAFNEEIVAKAIFESKIPIISAVGHETDFTIADFTADVRAPTPSAAAEIVIAEKGNLLQFLEQTRMICRDRVTHQAAQIRGRLDALQKHPLFSSPYAILSQPIQLVDSMRTSLDGAMGQHIERQKGKLDSFAKQLEILRPSTQIGQMKERLVALQGQIHAAISNQIFLKKERFSPLAFFETLDRSLKQAISQKKEALSRLSEHLRSLNPDRLIEKGYAIVFSEKGDSIILSANDLRPSQLFKVRLKGGTIAATANEVTLDT